jgi:hypothetical protein
MMTIFPFEINYEKEVPSTRDLENIMLVIKTLLHDEGATTNVAPIIEKNGLIFKNGFMSRNIFQAINKGKFTVLLNNSTIKLTYRFYMWRFFLIYIIGATLLAIFNKAIISSFYLSCWIYISMIWIGSLISNKLFFNRIIKKIKGEGIFTPNLKYKKQTGTIASLNICEAGKMHLILGATIKCHPSFKVDAVWL